MDGPALPPLAPRPSDAAPQPHDAKIRQENADLRLELDAVKAELSAARESLCGLSDDETEAKDRAVLEILQAKDATIAALRARVAEFGAVQDQMKAAEARYGLDRAEWEAARSEMEARLHARAYPAEQAQEELRELVASLKAENGAIKRDAEARQRRLRELEEREHAVSLVVERHTEAAKAAEELMREKDAALRERDSTIQQLNADIEALRDDGKRRSEAEQAREEEGTRLRSEMESESKRLRDDVKRLESQLDEQERLKKAIERAHEESERIHNAQHTSDAALIQRLNSRVTAFQLELDDRAAVVLETQDKGTGPDGGEESEAAPDMRLARAMATAGAAVLARDHMAAERRDEVMALEALIRGEKAAASARVAALENAITGDLDATTAVTDAESQIARLEAHLAAASSRLNTAKEELRARTRTAYGLYRELHASEAPDDEAVEEELRRLDAVWDHIPTLPDSSPTHDEDVCESELAARRLAIELDAARAELDALKSRCEVAESEVCAAAASRHAVVVESQDEEQEERRLAVEEREAKDEAMVELDVAVARTSQLEVRIRQAEAEAAAWRTEAESAANEITLLSSSADADRQRFKREEERAQADVAALKEEIATLTSALEDLTPAHLLVESGGGAAATPAQQASLWALQLVQTRSSERTLRRRVSGMTAELHGLARDVDRLEVALAEQTRATGATQAEVEALREAEKSAREELVQALRVSADHIAAFRHLRREILAKRANGVADHDVEQVITTYVANREAERIDMESQIHDLSIAKARCLAEHCEDESLDADVARTRAGVVQALRGLAGQGSVVQGMRTIILDLDRRCADVNVRATVAGWEKGRASRALAGAERRAAWAEARATEAAQRERLVRSDCAMKLAALDQLASESDHTSARRIHELSDRLDDALQHIAHVLASNHRLSAENAALGRRIDQLQGQLARSRGDVAQRVVQQPWSAGVAPIGALNDQLAAHAAEERRLALLAEEEEAKRAAADRELLALSDELSRRTREYQSESRRLRSELARAEASSYAWQQRARAAESETAAAQRALLDSQKAGDEVPDAPSIPLPPDSGPEAGVEAAWVAAVEADRDAFRFDRERVWTQLSAAMDAFTEEMRLARSRFEPKSDAGRLAVLELQLVDAHEECETYRTALSALRRALEGVDGLSECLDQGHPDTRVATDLSQRVVAAHVREADALRRLRAAAVVEADLRAALAARIAELRRGDGDTEDMQREIVRLSAEVCHLRTKLAGLAPEHGTKPVGVANPFAAAADVSWGVDVLGLRERILELGLLNSRVVHSAVAWQASCDACQRRLAAAEKAAERWRDEARLASEQVASMAARLDSARAELVVASDGDPDVEMESEPQQHETHDDDDDRQAQIDALQAELAAHQASSAGLSERHASETTALRQELEAAQSALRDCERNLSRTGAMYREAQTSILWLESASDTAAIESARAAAELRAARAEAALRGVQMQASAESESHAATVALLEQRLERAKERARRVVAEWGDVPERGKRRKKGERHHTSKLVDELAAKDAEIEALAAELRGARPATTKPQPPRETDARLPVLEQRVATLTTELRLAHAQLGDEAERREAAEAEATEASEGRAQAIHERRETALRLREAEARCAALPDSDAALVAKLDLETRVAALQGSLRRAEDRVERAEAELEEKRLEAAEREKSVDEVTRLRDRLKRATADARSKETVIRDLHTRIQGLEESSAAYKKRATAAEERARAATAEKSMRDESLKALRARVATLQESLADAETGTAGARAAAEHAQRDASRRSGQLRVSQETIAALEHEVAALRDARAPVEDNHVLQQNREKLRELRRAQKQLTESVSKLQSSLEASEAHARVCVGIIVAHGERLASATPDAAAAIAELQAALRDSSQSAALHCLSRMCDVVARAAAMAHAAELGREWGAREAALASEVAVAWEEASRLRRALTLARTEHESAIARYETQLASIESDDLDLLASTAAMQGVTPTTDLTHFSMDTGEL